MTVTKEAFVDLQEKYNKVIKLIVDDSKLDPENEPFLSKYSARQILIGMNASLENLLRHQPPDSKDHLKLTAMLGAVQLYLAIVAIDTEELSIGEKHLEKCREVIAEHQNKPDMIMVTLNMLNQFGILWSQREPEKSKIHLEQSERVYEQFKELSIPPVDIANLFHVNQDDYVSEQVAWKNFEKLHTFTLYYLAQIFGALKDPLKSSVYCHSTLKRQLASDDYEPIDWALNAATLAQVFMERNGFKQARHHLAASLFILNKYEMELMGVSVSERNETWDASMEVFQHRSADVARCWVKYNLLLLTRSKERLLNESTDLALVSTDLGKIALSVDSTVSLDDLQHLYFPDIDLSDYENQVTFNYSLTIEDARLLFINAQKWIDHAKSYYKLDTLASDHIEIIQDQSSLYLALLFFDDKPENQAKFHKRRIDILENIIEKVNPQYYLQYCRQIWFELAQIYLDVLNIKSDRLRELETGNQRPSPQALGKINTLAEKSIAHYYHFIESFRDATGEIPNKVPDDFEKPFLQAYFHAAALQGRIITLDRRIQLKNIESSLEGYQKVIDYCGRQEKAAELVRMELEICKEMAQLLPLKIAKLRHEID